MFEDVISITLTGLIKLPRSRVVFFARPQSLRVTLSFVLRTQQLLG